MKSKQNDEEVGRSSQKLDETCSYQTKKDKERQLKENSILYLAAPLSRLNHQDCDPHIASRSKLNSSRYSESPNKNPFGFANEVNEMIVISDSKSKENDIDKSKPSDLQMYQAQLRKKLDEDLDTTSLSRFLSASQGAHLKYLAGQSNS